MKTECNNCGRISKENIVFIHKGTSYAFCNERCENEYIQRKLDSLILMSPIYIGLILPFKMFRGFVKNNFKKKRANWFKKIK